MIQPDLAAGRLVQLSDVSIMNDHGYYLLTGPLAQGNMAAEAAAFRDWALAARDIPPSPKDVEPTPEIDAPTSRVIDEESRAGRR